jgi:hypothetical protein
MHRTSLRSLAIALAIIATMISSAYGQSLEDVARENRHKKGDNTSAAQPNLKYSPQSVRTPTKALNKARLIGARSSVSRNSDLQNNERQNNGSGGFSHKKTRF